MVKPQLEVCFEVFSKSLNLMFLNSEEYQRLCIIGLDNSCELAMKSFLRWIKNISKKKIPENFFDLKEQTGSYFINQKPLFYELFFYHEEIRNDLYHEGNKHSINLTNLFKQTLIAYSLFKILFDKDFSSFLQQEYRLTFIQLYVEARLKEKDLARIDEKINLFGKIPIEEINNEEFLELIDDLVNLG